MSPVASLREGFCAEKEREKDGQRREKASKFGVQRSCVRGKTFGLKVRVYLRRKWTQSLLEWKKQQWIK